MSSKDMKITVVGDGGWGTALSLLLAGKGFSVTLWGAFAQYTHQMNKKRENFKFLPGFGIPSNVRLTADIHPACQHADLIVLAAPSQHMRQVVKRIRRDHVKGKVFLSVSKGIETGTLMTMTQIIRDVLGPVKTCALSGPTIAREVAQKSPAAVTLASPDKRSMDLIRDLFATDYFSLYETDDVLGVELGGSIKNVIAIGSGIVEGLGFGTNTQSVLFARGVAEMARLGYAMGARRETFMGLSGLGDLATTCMNRTSRNRSLGEAVGKGQKLKSYMKHTEMVVEGADTAKSVAALAKKQKIRMPICEAVHGILFKGHDPRNTVKALLKGGSMKERD